ncbi:hypothetical protein [Alkalihalophilus pseudofirmus]
MNKQNRPKSKKVVTKKKEERFWREMMGVNKPRYERRSGAIRQK